MASAGKGPWGQTGTEVSVMARGAGLREWCRQRRQPPPPHLPDLLQAHRHHKGVADF